MARYIDLTGQRFGRWLVLEKTPCVGVGISLWKCVCDCGRIKERVMYNSLIRGQSKSCGCLRSELAMKPDNEAHSQRNPLYSIWMSMKTRCFNVKHPTYPRYGGRGITMCDEWRSSFDKFREDVGERPSPQHQLDRIDNNGNYEPGNVRWATRVMQANNTSRNIKVSWNGWIMNLIEVARAENVDYNILLARFRKGQDLVEIVAALKLEERPFFERAAELGGTIEPRTEQRRPGRRKHKPENLPKKERVEPKQRRKHGEPWETHRDEPKYLALERMEKQFRKDYPKPTNSQREKSKNQDLWMKINRCWSLGIQYRGPMPSDFNWKTHNRKGPLDAQVY